MAGLQRGRQVRRGQVAYRGSQEASARKYHPEAHHDVHGQRGGFYMVSYDMGMLYVYIMVIRGRRDCQGPGGVAARLAV